MDFLTVVMIAFALAVDAFAVALSAGAALGRADRRQTFRLSFHFGLFQFMMPILGWLAGIQVEHIIAAYDHWVAFTLLAILGGKMVISGIRGDADRVTADVTRGWTLIGLSVATSIDALAIGFSVAVMQVDILWPSIVIGIVAGAMTFLGIRLGEKVGAAVGPRMELVGGLVLIGIGSKIVIEHLGLFL